MKRSKKNSLLATMLLGAAMSDSMSPNEFIETPKKRETKSNIIIPPPKGTKEYFFNIKGEFSTESMLKTETVFMCFSINDKNALRKFNKWKIINQSRKA